MAREYDWQTTTVNTLYAHMLGGGVALSHLQFSSETMQWFCNEGRELLGSQAPLSYAAWESLFQRAWILYRDFTRTKSVAMLFAQVMRRGIEDLAAFVAICTADTHKQKNPELMQALNWFQRIMYQLQPGARLGINGDTDPSIADTRELLDRLVPVAYAIYEKTFPHVSSLDEIATSYYPGDRLGQELILAHWKQKQYQYKPAMW